MLPLTECRSPGGAAYNAGVLALAPASAFCSRSFLTYASNDVQYSVACATQTRPGSSGTVSVAGRSQCAQRLFISFSLQGGNGLALYRIAQSRIASAIPFFDSTRGTDYEQQ